ncbi:hypothetical protein [Gimesia chilikensis]|uniref:Uncharacterized protein n=1 Tax=Gimesia chilikensis TaxID=2605989 RepID=A0A517PGE8_9PLAN|nr:hypothetical protein [Gimesia chilikensis]QDT18452.1 hypothetical protein HG66A1_02130 [Gimesia chilikensis]
MELEADIIDRLRDDFDEQQAPAAIAELVASGQTGRIARCIVHAAHGSMERLRELTVSFLIASPDDFWILPIADVADRHGFRLTALESRPATAGPFEYTSDRNEGLACFSNGTTYFAVQKQDREWSISAPGLDVRPFGLKNTYDEEGLGIQLDDYLSRNHTETGPL